MATAYLELTNETRIVDESVLYRTRTRVDIPRLGVRAGDAGGWVASAANIDGHSCQCRLTGDYSQGRDMFSVLGVMRLRYLAPDDTVGDTSTPTEKGHCYMDNPYYFELTDETREFEGVTLHRIRATRDHPFFRSVKAGDLGGWVESRYNLGPESWVFSEGVVMGDALAGYRSGVHNQAIVRGSATLTESSIYDDALVTGHAELNGSTVSHHATVEGHALLVKTHVHDNAQVGGHVTLRGCQVADRAVVYIFDSKDEPPVMVNYEFLRGNVHIESARNIIGFTNLGYALGDFAEGIFHGSQFMHRVDIIRARNAQGYYYPMAAFNGMGTLFPLDSAFELLRSVDRDANDGKYATEIAAMEAVARVRADSW